MNINDFINILTDNAPDTTYSIDSFMNTIRNLEQVEITERRSIPTKVLNKTQYVVRVFDKSTERAFAFYYCYEDEYNILPVDMWTSYYNVRFLKYNVSTGKYYRDID